MKGQGLTRIDLAWVFLGGDVVVCTCSMILRGPGGEGRDVNLGSLAWIAHTDTDPAEM